jgi:hypothetical protein
VQSAIPTFLISRGFKQLDHGDILSRAEFLCQGMEFLLISCARKVQEIIDLILCEFGGHRV